MNYACQEMQTTGGAATAAASVEQLQDYGDCLFQQHQQLGWRPQHSTQLHCILQQTLQLNCQLEPEHPAYLG
jgi:hypothetical protein